MLPLASSCVDPESAFTGAWVWKALTWKWWCSPKTTQLEFLGCFLFSYFACLCLWHHFFTKFGCHLSCRERRNGGWRHDETAKGAHTHPPARLRTDNCACQCVWKTTALCGVRKRTWHQHFCVRDRRKLLPHYIGTGTCGPGGKEGGNVTTKFEGNIVLIRKQENVFLGMILIVYVGGCNRYLKYWMWPLKHWIL